MSLLDSLISKTHDAPDLSIVLPEGQDPRVMQAAKTISDRGIAKVIVLATPEEAADSAGEINFDGTDVSVVDWTHAPEAETLAAILQDRRKKRGMTMDEAREAVKDRLYFGNLMLMDGMAQGLVAGSIASTPDMLRAAFRCVGTASGIGIGSSCFLMDLAKPTAAGENLLLYADCGVNPDPTAEELVDIAVSTVQTHHALIGTQAKVAFLAFSTKGSAQHQMLEKVTEAARIAGKRFEDEGLDAIVDGEMQADAALVPAVAEKKAPDSPIRGDANILIFPDLNCGNIAYKLTQRLAGAAAYGPILQGLAKPVNDLSRGCSADDIVGVAAITACQAINQG